VHIHFPTVWIGLNNSYKNRNTQPRSESFESFTPEYFRHFTPGVNYSNRNWFVRLYDAGLPTAGQRRKGPVSWTRLGDLEWIMDDDLTVADIWVGNLIGFPAPR